MRTMDTTLTGEMLWERMVGAVQDVQNRLWRVTAALDQAGHNYAVIGGNAVAVWVARVDRSAVRNTQDVDLLIRRADFDGIKATSNGTTSGFAATSVGRTFSPAKTTWTASLARASGPSKNMSRPAECR